MYWDFFSFVCFTQKLDSMMAFFPKLSEINEIDYGEITQHSHII